MPAFGPISLITLTRRFAVVMRSAAPGMGSDHPPSQPQHARKTYMLALMGVLCSSLVGWSELTWGGTVSPVQSVDRPDDLDVVAPVQLAGSDEQAADFMENDLPVLQQTVSESLSERQAIDNPSGIALNPNKLKLESEADVRVYFIGEGAGYHNTLGYYQGDPNAISSGIDNTDAQLIFPDASSRASYLGSTAGYRRTQNYPLLAGDFVDPGTQEDDTQQNFFLIANGANGGTNIYTADPDLNPDGVDHFVSLAVNAVADRPYLLVGVEDLYGGGDQDYNDLVFSIDIGYENVAALIAATVPLPPSVLAIIGFLLFIGYSRKKQTPVAPERSGIEANVVPA